jgi:hypothetical protein
MTLVLIDCDCKKFEPILTIDRRSPFAAYTTNVRFTGSESENTAIDDSVENLLGIIFDCPMRPHGLPRP